MMMAHATAQSPAKPTPTPIPIPAPVERPLLCPVDPEDDGSEWLAAVVCVDAEAVVSCMSPWAPAVVAIVMPGVDVDVEVKVLEVFDVVVDVYAVVEEVVDETGGSSLLMLK